MKVMEEHHDKINIREEWAASMGKVSDLSEARKVVE